MCYKIEAAFMLIHRLKKDNSCTIGDLVDWKDEIETKYPSLFVDVSKSSILSFIFCFPEIFEFSDNRILKKENSEMYFKEPLIDYFNPQIAETDRIELIKLLEC